MIATKSFLQDLERRAEGESQSLLQMPEDRNLATLRMWQAGLFSVEGSLHQLVGTFQGVATPKEETMVKLIVAINLEGDIDQLVGKEGVNEGFSLEDLRSLPRGTKIVLDEVFVPKDTLDDSFLAFEFWGLEE